MSEDEYDFDKEAERVAADRGQMVVYPEPNQLQLDCDSPEAVKNCYDKIDEFQWSWDWIVLTASKTKGHSHLTITHPKKIFTEAERIAYQFALGSDPVRERLNLMRYNEGIEKPSRLFVNLLKES